MPFDTQEYDSGTYEQLSKNFGESYVMGKDYGGIAFLGYTRNSIISHANSMYSYFLEHLKADDIHPPLLGMAETKSKTIDIYAGSRPIELNHHTKLAHNLLGDPLTRPWVKVPKKIECLSRNNSHTLANIPEDGCIITTRNLNNETITSNCIAGKTSHTIDTIPPNVAMSVYGRSILPSCLNIDPLSLVIKPDFIINEVEWISSIADFSNLSPIISTLPLHIIVSFPPGFMVVPSYNLTFPVDSIVTCAPSSMIAIPS